MRSIICICLLFAPGHLHTVNVREGSNLVIKATESPDPGNTEMVQLTINFPAGTEFDGYIGAIITDNTNHVVVNARQDSQLWFATSKASEVPVCDAGWAYFAMASSCYKVSDAIGGFEAAEQLCQASEAHLVSITSMDEFNFVRGIIDNKFGAGKPGWIGLHTNDDCELEWTDGTEATTFSGLKTCFPNPLLCGLHMCSVIAPQPHNFYCAGGHYGPAMCTESHVVVCKKPKYMDIDECQDNNGGCSQMCVNLPGTFECQCQLGYSLASDGQTCNLL